MINLTNFYNVKNQKLLKEEYIKSKIEDSYQDQLTDYIFLQKKVNLIRNILPHKSQLSTLDYTKLNKYYNFCKSIIISKKKNKEDDMNWINKNLSHKKRINNNLDKKLYLSNPVLKKIFLSHEEDNNNINMTELNTEYKKDSSRYQSSFHRNNYLRNKRGVIDLKSTYINFRPKNDLYKLPNQIKNKYKYNLTNLKNNSIKRNYQIKDKMTKFDKFAKYFMRGLSLSEEQNAYYQKCKKIYMSFGDNNNMNMKLERINSFDSKTNKNKINTRIKREINKNINNSEYKNNSHRNKKAAMFKYSLKNLIKTENPIKILL